MFDPLLSYYSVLDAFPYPPTYVILHSLYLTPRQTTNQRSSHLMPDRDPRNIEKLKEQAEEEKEEKLEWKHETPAERQAEHEEAAAEEEAKLEEEFEGPDEVNEESNHS
jgi:hypothetical protein